MLFPPKSLFHIVCHPFELMNNVNICIINIQNIRNILKKKATWDEPIEMAQP